MRLVLSSVASFRDGRWSNMAESTAAVIKMLHGELGKAGKDEKAKLRVSRFRDNNKLMSSLLINYDKKDVDWKMYYKAAAAEDEPTPAPASAAPESAPADEEAPAA